ncbi:MAG: thioredoxin domain-containing protein [Acidobacteriota bacterium]
MKACRVGFTLALALIAVVATTIAAPLAPPPRQSASPLPDRLISLQGIPVKGRTTAKVAIIEYADFQCPYCAVFVRYTLPDLDRLYLKTGKVQLAFWQSPMSEIHPRAEPAAEAAECAARQGRFWEMHDALFDNQLLLDDRGLRNHAAAVGLNAGRFSACMAGEATASVRRQRAAAAALRVEGTPTYFIGTVQADGTVRVATQIIGMQRVEVFQAVLDPLIATGAAR